MSDVSFHGKLGDKFKQMVQNRQRNSKSSTTTSNPVVLPTRPALTPNSSKVSKVAKKSLGDRLGAKPKTLNDRLGKRIEERLGKPLEKGTIILGGHILGPKPITRSKKATKEI